MIFVSVGTQKFQMDRLMRQIEEIAANMPQEKFVVQYGNSTYVPKNCECHQFMDRKMFSKCIEESSLLILHGGVGTIMQGLKKDKPIIVVPRLKAYGEHVDDHQMEAAFALKTNKCLLICINVAFLEFMIRHINNYPFEKYIEPQHRVEDLVLECIEEDVEDSREKISVGKFLRRNADYVASALENSSQPQHSQGLLHRGI